MRKGIPDLLVRAELSATEEDPTDAEEAELDDRELETQDPLEPSGARASRDLLALSALGLHDWVSNGVFTVQPEDVADPKGHEKAEEVTGHYMDMDAKGALDFEGGENDYSYHIENTKDPQKKKRGHGSALHLVLRTAHGGSRKGMENHSFQKKTCLGTR